MELKLVVYHWNGDIFLGPFDLGILPVGTIVAVADSRCKIVLDPDEPVPANSPYTYRLNRSHDNPRLERITGDPLGLDHPCFSAGFRRLGKSFWTNPALIDQGEFCLTFILEEGDLCFDYEMWDTDIQGEGAKARRTIYTNTPLIRGREGRPDNVDPVLYGTKPSIVVLPETPPIVDPSSDQPSLILPTLADGPSEGMDIWSSWKDGRLNGIELCARFYEKNPENFTADSLRRLK